MMKVNIKLLDERATPMELKTYRWNGCDSPVKKDDHCLDEMRYYIMNIQEKPISTFREKTTIQQHKEKLYRELMKR